MSKQLRCPVCRSLQSAVADMRGENHGTCIRRRRLCECGHRYTTYETIKGHNLVASAKTKVRFRKIADELIDLMRQI